MKEGFIPVSRCDGEMSLRQTFQSHRQSEISTRFCSPAIRFHRQAEG